MKRNTSIRPDRMVEKIYAVCQQMPPQPAAEHLDAESRAYIGELLLARAIVIIRTLTPKEKLPAGAYDIDDPYLITDLAVIVNQFARLDAVNLPAKRGRKAIRPKLVRNYLRELAKMPRARGRRSSRTLNADEKRLRIYEGERARQHALGIRLRSLKEFWTVWAEHLEPQWAKANLRPIKGGQGLSAAQLRSSKKDAAIVAGNMTADYLRARERLRKRRQRAGQKVKNK